MVGVPAAPGGLTAVAAAAQGCAGRGEIVQQARLAAGGARLNDAPQPVLRQPCLLSQARYLLSYTSLSCCSEACCVG